ncbi:hypothetical protein ACFL2E_05670 [Thermodesulfobacteriota bacterium]
MNKKHYISILALFNLILLLSCNGGEMREEQPKLISLKDIPQDKWEKLSQKKIYFGHQSVGFNILNGIKEIIKDNPMIKLNIVKTAELSDFKDGVFAHSGIGKNGYPKTKIDQFAKFVNNGIGNEADYAFFKFCYVDIRNETDANKVFSEYKESMTKIINTYPNTTFIQVTAPLEIELTMIQRMAKYAKDVVKKIIGKHRRRFYKGNINRHLFNEKIIEEYRDHAPIFDLAKIESTFSDGTRCSFEKDGKTYYSLAPKYTYDGKHLNKIGQRKAAEQLLVLLANLP